MYYPCPLTPLNVVIELLQILFIKLMTKYIKSLKRDEIEYLKHFKTRDFRNSRMS